VAKIQGDQLKITVSDTGIGIAEENQQTIFEEFRQADSSTTRMYGGTGLGLAIVKRYVEFMDGAITLESRIGQGSVFIVTIPIPSITDDQSESLERDSIDRALDFTSFASRPITKTYAEDTRERLLIVEDSEPAIIQLQDAFGQEGYQISIARDGYEAIQMIREIQPDGIVLDLMMPRIDGFEVLKTIRGNEETAHIPVLVLSAKHMTKDELSELKHNRVVQLIQKGNVHLEELKAAVAAMLHPVEEVIEPIKREVPSPIERPVVLVVEDNPDNRITARAVLEDYYIVIEAEDGEEAVRIAAEKVPDLILMDNALPGMDGVEAFRIIRGNEDLAHIPVIALTASAMTTDREIFLAYGFDGFVPKPIIEEELLKTIRGALYGV